MKIQNVFLHDIELKAKYFQKVYEVNGRYVNDHCFICKDDEMHLFYIDGEEGRGCYDLGNEIIIGHAVSKDLIHWQEKQTALIRDEAFDYEERGIFAPYIYEKDGVYYMFYSSHNIQKAQFMCLAYSNNLYDWEKCEKNPLFIPSGNWALWDESIPCSCRDPHIYWDESGSEFIMFWVGDLKEDSQVSCIAASRSKDLQRWQEIGPVLKRNHSEYEGINCKTESPCLIKKEDLYYLFYRHGNGTKYCISDNYVDFTYRDSYYLGSSHASEIFQYDNQWYISSCSRDVADITHQTDRRKGLWLARLSWDGLHPEIIPF